MPVVPILTEFDYVLKEERDLSPEKRATFRLRPLKYREREFCERTLEFRDDGDGPVFTTEQFKIARRILNCGLMGWTGVKDSEGNEVVFKRSRDTVSEECLDLIAPWANELANAITNNARVTEEQAKN